MDASLREQGRVDYLRLSITDRCNLRCTYCMPPEGVPARAHGDILSYEELAAFARVAADVGISKVRITGGEPLVRHGCADFVGMLAAPAASTTSRSPPTACCCRASPATSRRRACSASTSASTASTRTRFARITRGGRLDDDAGRHRRGLRRRVLAGQDQRRCCCRASRTSSTRFVELTRERASTCASSSSCRSTGACRRRPRRRVAACCRRGDLLRRLMERYELGAARGPLRARAGALLDACPGALGTIGFIAGVSEHFCETLQPPAPHGRRPAAHLPVLRRGGRRAAAARGDPDDAARRHRGRRRRQDATTAAARRWPTSGRCPRSEGDVAA